MSRQPIGLSDRDGTPIHEGDLVEYVITYDGEEAVYNTGDGLRFVDQVKVDDEGAAYFWDADIEEGAFAWRHAAYCRVIGNIHDVPDIAV